MKVGILTFQNSFNFGAQLQAYALQRTISKIGYSVDVVNYSMTAGNFKSNMIFKSKLAVKSLLLNPKKFYEFRKRFNLSKIKYNNSNIKEADDVYDIYVTGSDQVWNPEYCRKTNVYLLGFTKKSRISYAASFGVSDIDDCLYDYYKNNLEKFNAISLREKVGCNLCKKIINRKNYHVIDPTLLLSKEDWNNDFSLKNDCEKYVLIYMLEYSQDLLDAGIKYANAKKMKYKVISGTPRAFYKKGVQYGMHPIKFLKLFYNAEYIFTNSFHGTIFSINFKKQFFVKLLVKNEKVNSRLTDIMKEFNLEDRFIYNKVDNDNKINYKKVDSILLEKRKESLNYLITKLGACCDEEKRKRN